MWTTALDPRGPRNLPFGLNDGFWTGLQLDYDAVRVKDELSAELAKITPLELAS